MLVRSLAYFEKKKKGVVENPLTVPQSELSKKYPDKKILPQGPLCSFFLSFQPHHMKDNKQKNPIHRGRS